MQEGLIIPVTEVYKFYRGNINDSNKQLAINNELATYKFLHDRVQQAAYSFIPSEQKQATHLKIGQLLLNNISVAAREDKIFDIVNQLNIGVELITQQTERLELAQLNLIAGRKAKTSTAYAAAVEYFTIARNLLVVDSWQQYYKLTLALYECNAEAEY